MNPPIIIEKTSRKRIRALDNNRDTLALAIYNPETREHKIVIPYRASTKTRLHEIAHCEMSHCVDSIKAKKMSIDKFVENEIDADEYAFSKCGKPISMENVINLAHSLIVEFKCNLVVVFNACIKALAKHGYKLDREQRSELWWQCREFEKERQKTY
jgi:hypothetical protein